MSTVPKTVLVFGSFDPLHAGHRDFFRQAKALGTTLTVVVACDSMIAATKQHAAQQDERVRLAAVAALPEVDQALLGSEPPHHFELLHSQAFDVLALGYDQTPDDATIRQHLAAAGKAHVTIVRLQPYKPETYKSSLLRTNS